MSRKYTLKDLENWGHIKDYELKKLEELGFNDVHYEDRMSTINKKNCNYQFWTNRSRRGFMSYSLTTIKPYKQIFPVNNYYCRSSWQCIKKYIEIAKEQEEAF